MHLLFACFLVGIQATEIILNVPHKDGTEAHPGTLSLSLTKTCAQACTVGMLVCERFSPTWQPWMIL